jgi:hypothetical protein
MEQALSFEGTGLDLDNNYATISPGDSPFRLNCRYGTTDRSDLGGIQNFKGDTFISKEFGKNTPFIQPEGENEVIGSCKDLERDAIIYFVWNKPSNPSLSPKHQIRRYYSQTGEIQVILESSVLNFQRDHKITSANVVDKYLSWTDGYENPDNEWDYNPPRQIDMELAYGYMIGNPWPLGYQVIDKQTLDAIKYAPNLCPTFTYEDDLNFNDNRLYGHLFQFGYRYVYYDNSRSVISPLSKMTLPQGEDIDGNYNLQVENRIDITYNTGHYTVKTIEIVAKEGTSWKVVDTIDKYNESGTILPDFTDTTVQFFNTKFVAEIPISEALRPFDYVPQVASTQEVISSQGGARRVYGNYIEGYENVEDIELTADVKIEKINPENPNYKNLTFKRKGTYQIGVVYSDKAGRKSFVQTNPNAKLSIPWWRSTELIDQYYNPNDEWILSTHQKPYIEWNLQGQAPSWATSYQIVCTKDISNQQRLFTFYNFGSCVGDKEFGRFKVGANSIYIPPQVGYDFQKGDRIRVIAQFDNSKNETVVGPNVEGPLIGLIPADPSIAYETQQLGNANQLATITPNNPYNLVLEQTYNNPNQIILDSEIKSFNPQTQRIIIEDEFNLDYTSLYAFEIYNSNLIISEESQNYFETGESYIINTQGQHSVTSGRIDGIDVFIGNYKYEFNPIPFIFSAHRWGYLRKKDPDIPQFFYIPNVNLESTIPSTINLTFLSTFRPFRPYGEEVAINPQTSYSTYSIGNAVVIGSESSGKVSINGSYKSIRARWNGSETQVTALLPVDGTFQDWEDLFSESEYEEYLGSDATFTIKSPNVKFDVYNVFMESQSYSTHYTSEVDQAGRPYIINKEAVRRRYFANLIWGGQFFDNTLLNFFSRYESESVLKLNERYNEITRMQEVGFMLKVRQRNKSTSIYVGRTELTNADGSSNLAASNNVLGTVNVSDEIWGGTNGTAECRAVRDTYFFDYINGTVVRDATNGLVAISGNLTSPQDPYKMTAFFRDLSEWFKSNEKDVEVVSTWDNHTQSVIITFRSLIKSDRTIPDFIYKYKLEEAWNGGLTLSFHEPTNRWQTFHSYVREWYETIGNTLVSFDKGNLYLHYSNNNRTEYMGVKYPVITAQICNQYTNNVKVFDNIDVYSNRKWKAEGLNSLDDIYILPNAQFPNGMRSKLSYNNFVGKEGKWHASFLCDINTPGYTNTLLALMNGRRLRGEAMKVTLRNEDETEVFLRQVIFHFTPSELSGGGG